MESIYFKKEKFWSPNVIDFRMKRRKIPVKFLIK